MRRCSARRADAATLCGYPWPAGRVPQQANQNRTAGDEAGRRSIGIFGATNRKRL
jgi:hypothetical protein